MIRYKSICATSVQTTTLGKIIDAPEKLQSHHFYKFLTTFSVINPAAERI